MHERRSHVSGTKYPGFIRLKSGGWRGKMSQVSTVLDRTDRSMHGASALQVRLPAADRGSYDDDDLLDEWLVSMSVDDFERFLTGLAELR